METINLTLKINQLYRNITIETLYPLIVLFIISEFMRSEEVYICLFAFTELVYCLRVCVRASPVYYYDHLSKGKPSRKWRMVAKKYVCCFVFENASVSETAETRSYGTASYCLCCPVQLTYAHQVHACRSVGAFGSYSAAGMRSASK